MTIAEVVGPVMVPLAYGIAVTATLLMLWHVRGSYATSPNAVPIGIRWDGRPRRLGSKRWLLLAPAIMALLMVVVGVLAIVAPGREDQRPVLALVFIVIAECAWLVAWSTDRQVELARKQTFRISPGRTLRAALPLLATVVALAVVVLRAP